MISFNEHGVSIREAVEEDIPAVAVAMRMADVAEVWASDHQTPVEALMTSFSLSIECYTLLRGEEPVAMFGLVPDTFTPGRAVIWLLGTDGISRIPKKFTDFTKRVISIWLQSYEILFNHTDVRNQASRRWLERCGATFHEPQPFGAERLHFTPFFFRRPAHV